MKKYLFLSLLLLIFLPNYSFADQQDQSVSVIVDGKYYQCGSGGGSPVTREIQFYHSDSCSNDFLASLQFGSNPSENEEKCRRTSQYVNTNVWGIRVNSGSCIDVSDADFMTACMRYQ